MENSTDKISVYECNYKKQFPCRGFYALLTARQKLARLIDSSWFHSIHWPDDHNSFLDKAQEDLHTEMTYARERVAQLEQAQKIISRIERQADDIEESPL